MLPPAAVRALVLGLVLSVLLLLRLLATVTAAIALAAEASWAHAEDGPAPATDAPDKLDEVLLRHGPHQAGGHENRGGGTLNFGGVVQPPRPPTRLRRGVCRYPPLAGIQRPLSRNPGIVMPHKHPTPTIQPRHGAATCPPRCIGMSGLDETLSGERRTADVATMGCVSTLG